MREGRDNGRGDDDARGRQRDRGAERWPDVTPPRVEPAGEEDEGERDHADVLRDVEVGKGDPPGPLGSREHPDEDEDEERRNAEPPRSLAGKDGQEQERRPDEERPLEPHWKTLAESGEESLHLSPAPGERQGEGAALRSDAPSTRDRRAQPYSPRMRRRLLAALAATALSQPAPAPPPSSAAPALQTSTPASPRRNRRTPACHPRRRRRRSPPRDKRAPTGGVGRIDPARRVEPPLRVILSAAKDLPSPSTRIGGAGRTRTADLEFRKLLLYPPELRPRESRRF